MLLFSGYLCGDIHVGSTLILWSGGGGLWITEFLIGAKLSGIKWINESNLFDL